MNILEILEKNVGKRISYRNDGSRRVVSGILLKDGDSYSTKLGVLYMPVDPNKVEILSIED